jgi:hypothetical protein
VKVTAQETMARHAETRNGNNQEVKSVKNHSQQLQDVTNNDAATESSLKRFVTFYVTNFPPQASTIFLRKGFEVCGILEDVFVSNNRNRNGDVYGFVRYAKVRDVDKLLKALNNVCFSQYCVRAVLARFDRKGLKKGDVVRKGEGVDGEEGAQGVERGGEMGKKESEGEKRKNVRELKEGKGEMVSDERRKGMKGEGVRSEEGKEEGLVRRSAGTDTLKTISKLVRKYGSIEEDRNWANNGLIGTMIGGESIPLIQSRVEDAGFKDIDIIPLGADKVFIRSLSDVNVLEIMGATKNFFDLIFSSLSVRNQAVMPFQRGAWIRLYGVPLQAWNENFFKLCIFDCGRYLRADMCTLNKERCDYARVLISTSSLDVINASEQIIVDGVLVDIKIVEEWGFCLGDDACLYEEEEKSESEIPEAADINDDIGFNADILVNKMAKDVEDDDELF